jgi:hypothetical protein
MLACKTLKTESSKIVEEFAEDDCGIMQLDLLLGTVTAGPFCEAGGSFF